MTRVGGVMCDHCGTESECTPLFLGVQRWETCARCYGALGNYQSTGLVFGLPLDQLPRPTSTKTMWIAYRLAAQGLGYTLFTADTRGERDALHADWSMWMTYIVRVEREHGCIGDHPKQNHYLLPFLAYLEEQYGPTPSRNARLDAWILENVPRAVLRSTREQRIFATIPPPRSGTRGRSTESAA